MAGQPRVLVAVTACRASETLVRGDRIALGAASIRRSGLHNVVLKLSSLQGSYEAAGNNSYGGSSMAALDRLAA